jgi:uncharacterized protein YyaL (SSP411 family)
MGGLLDDQVQVALAAVEAYETTGERRWLDWSVVLMDRVWAGYRDPQGGGLWDTATGPGGEGLLPTRARPVQDTPTPSPNGTAAICCARLAEITQAPRWRERLDELIRAFASAAPELAIFGATFLRAVNWAVQPATHLVVIEGGPSAGDATVAEAMHSLALGSYAARRVVLRVHGAGSAEPLPAAVATMASAAAGPRGYACIGATCGLPATSIEEWRTRLDEIKSRSEFRVPSSP